MQKKLNLKKIFDQEFKYYWRKKKPAGRQELKEEPGYVLRVSEDYYKMAAPFLSSSEVKAFFEWLAQEEPYFADDHLFSKRIREWSSSRPERRNENELPQSFKDFLNNYAFIAYKLCAEHGPCEDQRCPYRMINSIIGSLQACYEYRKDFVGMSEKARYERFYGWLRNPGIKEDILVKVADAMRVFELECANLKKQKEVQHG